MIRYSYKSSPYIWTWACAITAIAPIWPSWIWNKIPWCIQPDNRKIASHPTVDSPRPELYNIPTSSLHQITYVNGFWSTWPPHVLSKTPHAWTHLLSKESDRIGRVNYLPMVKPSNINIQNKIYLHILRWRCIRQHSSWSTIYAIKCRSSQRSHCILV